VNPIERIDLNRKSPPDEVVAMVQKPKMLLVEVSHNKPDVSSTILIFLSRTILSI
jgi:hypothetical protein